MSEQAEAWKKMVLCKRDVNDSRNTVTNYDTFWDYEQVVATLGYKQAPETAAKVILEYKGNMGHHCKLLDVGAGSGLVGKALREQGYAGVLHAIDGSSGMLEQAKRKKIYDGIFCQFLSQETPMLVENDSYDAVISCAAFTHGYIDYKVISQVVGALKQGGILVVTVRTNNATPEYQANFAAELEKCSSRGLVEKLRIETIDCHCSVDYSLGISAEGDKKNCPAKLFCYKKL